MKDAPAVVIAISRPGGSPVQSRMIYSRIRELAREKQKKVLVFVEHAGASGCDMIALAGDEIIADATSIVGSASSGRLWLPRTPQEARRRCVYTPVTTRSSSTSSSRRRKRTSNI